MKEYVLPINDNTSSCIQLGEAVKTDDLKNINYFLLSSFYGFSNKGPLNFII